MARQVSSADDLHQIIYVSQATREVFKEQRDCVNHILAIATVNNARLNVTGALLATDDWFVQALEGRRADVDGLTGRIERDRNHRNLLRLVSRPIEQRSFGAWSMCASTLSPTDEAVVRVLETSGKFDPRNLGADRAMRLLASVARLQPARNAA